MSKKTKIVVVLVVVVLIAVGFALSKEQSSLRQSNLIKIGALYALTGPASKFGQISAQGVQDAVEYFQSKNPQVKVDLVLEDSQGDPKQGVTGATKLATIDDVDVALVGLSAVSAAVAPIADQYKKVFISDASLYTLTKDKQYIFQNFIPALNDIANKVNAKNEFKKIAIFYMNDDFGQAWSEKIKNQINKNTVVELFPFDKTATDLKTDALKIKNSNSDAIIVLGAGPVLNQAFSDLALNEVAKPIYTYLACTLPGVLTDKRYNLNEQISYEYPSVKNTEIKTWIESKGRDLNAFYTVAFENTLVALQAVKDSKGDSSKITSVLKSKKFAGLLGEVDFNGKNYSEADLEYTKIVDGKCVPVK